jgi:hypothetical protein
MSAWNRKLQVRLHEFVSFVDASHIVVALSSRQMLSGGEIKDRLTFKYGLECGF